MTRIEPIPLGLDYPASPIAHPPIRPPECKDADTAICRYHKGRISQGLTASDFYGRVLFCPIGQQYWRLTPRVPGMFAPLSFPKGL